MLTIDMAAEQAFALWRSLDDSHPAKPALARALSSEHIADNTPVAIEYKDGRKWHAVSLPSNVVVRGLVTVTLGRPEWRFAA